MDDIIIFTDGATPNNQNKKLRKGGIGVYFPHNTELNISLQLEGNITNNICELTACIEGLKKIIMSMTIKKCITIYSDSMYVINSITVWAKNWKKNNWKKADNKEIENKDLIKNLYYLSKNLGVKYIHVKAHKNAPNKDNDDYFEWYGNMMADKLATECIK